jgi:acylphosphatase
MRRVHVEVSGRVQGVFYRATCAERARELGLGGWIRNSAGGGVEAEFEGDEQDVETIVAWCRSARRRHGWTACRFGKSPLRGSVRSASHVDLR